MRYSLQDLNTESQNPSLVIAFANLLAQVGEAVDPADLQATLISDNRPLSWLSLPEHFDWLNIESASDSGGWPSTNDAIVKFLVIDQGMTVEHYCLVSDPLDHTIVDSYDGNVKSFALYGNPQGWAQYTEVDRIPVTVEPSPPASNRLYTWLQGDILSMVARRIGCTGQELLEHNDIDNADDITPGTVLHLPHPMPEVPDRSIRYEQLPEKLEMHVSKDGGTKKWRFGNAKTWEDFSTAGFYPHNMNITIVGVAYVPITDKDGSQVEAAYYMDTMSFGAYNSTGQVSVTTGFNWSDLETGHVDRHKPAPIVEAATSLPTEVLEEKKVEFQQMVADEANEHPEKYPNFFKSTYQHLDVPIPCTAVLPPELEFIWIEDHDNKRPPRKLHQSQEITIAGTFERASVFYARPLKAAENDYWFGVPMDVLISNDDLYNTDKDRDTRAATNTLFWHERFLTEPIARFWYSPLVRKVIKHKKER